NARTDEDVLCLAASLADEGLRGLLRRAPDALRRRAESRVCRSRAAAAAFRAPMLYAGGSTTRNSCGIKTDFASLKPRRGKRLPADLSGCRQSQDPDTLRRPLAAGSRLSS